MKQTKLGKYAIGLAAGAAILLSIRGCDSDKVSFDDQIQDPKETLDPNALDSLIQEVSAQEDSLKSPSADTVAITPKQINEFSANKSDTIPQAKEEFLVIEETTRFVNKGDWSAKSDTIPQKQKIEETSIQPAEIEIASDTLQQTKKNANYFKRSSGVSFGDIIKQTAHANLTLSSGTYTYDGEAYSYNTVGFNAGLRAKGFEQNRGTAEIFLNGGYQKDFTNGNTILRYGISTTLKGGGWSIGAEYERNHFKGGELNGLTRGNLAAEFVVTFKDMTKKRNAMEGNKVDAFARIGTSQGATFGIRWNF